MKGAISNIVTQFTLVKGTISNIVTQFTLVKGAISNIIVYRSALIKSDIKTSGLNICCGY